jgi:hypothetical protein
MDPLKANRNTGIGATGIGTVRSYDKGLAACSLCFLIEVLSPMWLSFVAWDDFVDKGVEPNGETRVFYFSFLLRRTT